MRRLLWLAPALLLCAQSPKYDVGRAPSPQEIARWDISIRPDGKGLPAGQGSVAAGREIFANRCAKCHGTSGQGSDSVALAGGQGSLNGPKPLKTVSSYWPYATTVFDYVRRAMPFDNPGTLSDEQVYSLTAYVLYLGGVVPLNTTLDARTLPQVRMPNRDGFIPDPRPDTGRAK